MKTKLHVNPYKFTLTLHYMNKSSCITTTVNTFNGKKISFHKKDILEKNIMEEIQAFS